MFIPTCDSNGLSSEALEAICVYMVKVTAMACPFLTTHIN